MIPLTAIKYYSMGKHSSPLDAAAEIERLKEKYPDREYVALINMRATCYKRYIVCQVKTEKVDVPEDKDLDLPPVRPAPPYHYRYSRNLAQAQEWQDYEFELNRRNGIVAKVMAPIMAILHQKLNP